MSTLPFGASFVCLRAGMSLLLSYIPWFQRRVPLTDRLLPYVDRDDWTADAEAWLRKQ